MMKNIRLLNLITDSFTASLQGINSQAWVMSLREDDQLFLIGIFSDLAALNEEIVKQVAQIQGGEQKLLDDINGMTLCTR